MKLLCIDSSSSCAAVAIMNDDKVISELTYNDKKQHSVILMNLIMDSLKNSDLTINDIDGIVVSKGPGSFTGLRIGMATAKSLAHGLKSKYASVSSLDALATNLEHFNGLICPVFDALRNNVYTTVFSGDGRKLTRLIEPCAIDINELCEKLNSFNKDVIFVGDDSIKFKEALSKVNNSTFANPSLNLVRASSLGVLALSEDLLKEDFESISKDSPIYLRASQAEREYENKHGKTVYED